MHTLTGSVPVDLAPELDVVRWFNTEDNLTLSSLRGRVVMIEAFQMLCPGCVAHGIPQAKRVNDFFSGEVVVVGLHTVFEHHAAMAPVSLEAFLHEYRIDFPVGVDRHEDGRDMPLTMTRYGMRGTPSMILIDKIGRIRSHTFGSIDDLALGAAIAGLTAEKGDLAAPRAPEHNENDCGPEGCAVHNDGEDQ